MVHRDDARTVVTTGLDPVVHPVRIKFLRRRWIAGSSPAMTAEVADVWSSSQDQADG
jgi:hypothetical protein